ncbi:MAG: hypothetical protein ACI32F_08190 [Allobaculum sp.]
MNRNPHSLKQQDKPAFVSIHDQKHRAQYGYGAMSTPKKNPPHSAKQNRPHIPMARVDDSLQTPKKPRMPLYSPSRFR